MVQQSKSDGELLREFVAGGTEEPFEEIVRRHGPLVFGVCRRALGSTHDAEDAAQATFMALAMKARSLQDRASLGGWLHHVAWHVSLHARRSAARARLRQQEARDMQEDSRRDSGRSDQLKAVLDHELDHLPESQRLPLILHYLEGFTQEQVARLVGCPVGTVSARLNRARELLRSRLLRRGVALPSASLTVLLVQSGAQAEIPAAFIASTSKAATLAMAGKLAGEATLGPNVSALTKGAIQRMFIAKMKFVAAVFLAVTVTSSLGVVTWRALAEDTKAPKVSPPTAPAIAVAPAGVVSHIKVLSDKVPDISTLDAWKKSFIKDDMTDEQKAMAVWKTVWTFQHQDGPPMEFLHNEGHVSDVLKIFHVYGYSYCGIATADVETLARHVGLKARGWTIVNHVVPEIFYDNAWHLLDSSLICYFPKADNKAASIEEIIAGVSEWLGKNPGLKGNDAKLRDYQFKGPGWKQGPEILTRCPTYQQQGWLPALTHGWYSTMQEYDGSNKMEWEPGYSQGYELNIQLRKGEKLTRNWSNKGLHVNLPNGGPGCLTMKTTDANLKYTLETGDLSNGRVGNGTLEYNVPLASGDYKGGALVAENLACTADDQQAPALHLRDAAKPGELVVRMPSSYVYLGGEITCKAAVGEGGEIAVAFSDNHGLDWKELAKLAAGENKIDLKPHIQRRYDYRVRFTLKGKGTGLDALKFFNDIQHSQRPLPALGQGENKIAFSAGAQEGTITLEASTVPGVKGKQLVYTDFHPIVNNLGDSELPVKGEAGEITFTVNTPGDMTRLRFGTHYRARDKRDGWDYQVSFDAGKTFKTVERASGPTARDVKYTTFGEIPAGTRAAQVRFAGTNHGSATLIMGFRIDADYREPNGAFLPVKVTYLWEENGQPKQDVHVAKAAEDNYTIKCDSKPAMKSIVLELE